MAALTSPLLPPQHEAGVVEVPEAIGVATEPVVPLNVGETEPVLEAGG